MSSRHLVDPEFVQALDILPSLPLTLESLPEWRAMLASMVATGEDAEAMPAGTELFVPGPAGAPDVRLLVYNAAPEGTGRPVYYHIHGGGFVVGSVEMVQAANQRLAAELGCIVVTVDYRLAPETQFPGNIEDCYAGLEWVHAHAASLGGDAAKIAIGGESAGGGLTAALALMARDRGRVPIIHQQLVYPMLDDRSCHCDHPYTGEFGWTRAYNAFGWRSILGQEPGGADVSPYAAAARATALEGLPPAFISVGTLDLFVEENLDYARRLIRAGVPVELHVYPGAFHGSDSAVEARLTKLHLRDQIEALRSAFAR